MSYRVEITDRAQLDIDEFARHCRDYSADFWNEQEARLAIVYTIDDGRTRTIVAFAKRLGAVRDAALDRAMAGVRMLIRRLSVAILA
jgi:hypothetical protein